MESGKGQAYLEKIDRQHKQAHSLLTWWDLRKLMASYYTTSLDKDNSSKVNIIISTDYQMRVHLQKIK